MTIEISESATRLLLEIWRQLDFAPGSSGEWPDPDNMKERPAEAASFIRTPINKDSARLTDLALHKCNASQKTEALKELLDKKLLFHFMGTGHHPTVLTRTFLVNNWPKFVRDPELFNSLFELKSLENAEKEVALWDYRVAVSALIHVKSANAEVYKSKVEQAKVKYELVHAKYEPLQREREKRHDRFLGFLYALLGGMLGACFTWFLK